MSRPYTNPTRETLLSAIAGIPVDKVPSHLKRRLGWVPNEAGSGNTKRQRKRKKRAA